MSYSDAEKFVRSCYPLNLAEVTKILEQFPLTRRTKFGFDEACSWRGSYYELAFVITEVPSTIGKMLDVARSADGATFEGYKGGDFTMGPHTECYLVNDGSETGGALTEIVLRAMIGADVEYELSPGVVVPKRFAEHAMGQVFDLAVEYGFKPDAEDALKRRWAYDHEVDPATRNQCYEEFVGPGGQGIVDKAHDYLNKYVAAPDHVFGWHDGEFWYNLKSWFDGLEF